MDTDETRIKTEDRTVSLSVFHPCPSVAPLLGFPHAPLPLPVRTHPRAHTPRVRRAAQRPAHRGRRPGVDRLRLHGPRDNPDAPPRQARARVARLQTRLRAE